MSSPIIRQLILKDLHLLRWISVGTLVGGLIAAGLMTLSPYPIGPGGVLLICALVILTIFLVMNGVVQERKDKVAVFVLSLPVSPQQYVLAKVTANAVSFLVPWSIVGMAVLSVVGWSQIPNGFLPLWTAILGCIFFYYFALLAVGLNTTSTGWHAAAITVGNIAVNFLIMVLFSLPSVRAYGDGPRAVWTTDVVGIVVAEIVGGLAVLALAIYVHLRRAEFL